MMPVYFDASSFLARIDEIRKQRGISLMRMARETGVDRRTLYRARKPGRDGLSTHAVVSLMLWSGMEDILPYAKRYEEVAS